MTVLKVTNESSFDESYQNDRWHPSKCKKKVFKMTDDIF